MNPDKVLLTVLIGGTIVITMIFSARYNARRMQHEEMLAALAKGVDLPVPPTAPWTPRSYLLSGMIWLFAGLACAIAITAIASTSNRPLTVDEKLRQASRARAEGATPEEIQMLLNDSHAGEPLPSGLGFLGLIPMSVGLAYLIFYRVESKKLLS